MLVVTLAVTLAAGGYAGVTLAACDYAWVTLAVTQRVTALPRGNVGDYAGSTEVPALLTNFWRLRPALLPKILILVPEQSSANMW